MELSSLRIKKFLIFSQKEAFYISRNVYSGKWNFLAKRLETFLYFIRREFAKPEKQTKICSEEISNLLLHFCNLYSSKA